MNNMEDFSDAKFFPQEPNPKLYSRSVKFFVARDWSTTSLSIITFGITAMQDSFLSNDSDVDMNEHAPKKPKIPGPDRKMYALEIPFYAGLK